MAEGVPDKEETECAMNCIRPNFSGGPLEMWVEHLKIWLAAAWAEEKPDPSRWQIVVEIIQLVFATGKLDI